MDRLHAGGLNRSSSLGVPMSRPMRAAPLKPVITIADLDRVDIRVGTIESVRDVPGSDKLVELTVRFGDHTRSILAGISVTGTRRSELRALIFLVETPQPFREDARCRIGHFSGLGVVRWRIAGGC